MSGQDSSARRTRGRTDGGEREGDADSSGGWLSRLFPGRDERIRSLRRQLREAERETDELNDEVERLEQRIEELETENRELGSETEAYRQRQFAFDALLTSVGRSFQRANEDLGGSNVVVGDLDVTLRADVSGGGTQDSLDLRLVDPDEGIDPDRLSTVSFSVGRRGRFRHYGRSDARPSSGEAGGGGFMMASPAEPPGEGATPEEEGDVEGEGTRPSGPPVEVPNVTGLSVEAAETELRAEGFDVHTEDESESADIVVEQWPRAFAVAPNGSTVVILVEEEEEEA